MRSANSLYTQILTKMAIGKYIGEHQKVGSYIEYEGNGFCRIGLYDYEYAPTEDFSLVIHAGDTCRQAKMLYQHFSQSKVIELEREGWNVGNHFHLAWQSKNILFTSGDKSLSVKQYSDYWRRELNSGNIRRYEKEEFSLLKSRMHEANIMNISDMEAFDAFFKTHNYNTAITCPGIVNWISFPKSILSNQVDDISQKLRKKMLLLINIYSG